MTVQINKWTFVTVTSATNEVKNIGSTVDLIDTGQTNVNLSASILICKKYGKQKFPA